MVCRHTHPANRECTRVIVSAHEFTPFSGHRHPGLEARSFASSHPRLRPPVVMSIGFSRHPPAGPGTRAPPPEHSRQLHHTIVTELVALERVTFVPALAASRNAGDPGVSTRVGGDIRTPIYHEPSRSSGSPPPRYRQLSPYPLRGQCSDCALGHQRSIK